MFVFYRKSLDIEVVVLCQFFLFIHIRQKFDYASLIALQSIHIFFEFSQHYEYKSYTSCHKSQPEQSQPEHVTPVTWWFNIFLRPFFL